METRAENPPDNATTTAPFPSLAASDSRIVLREHAGERVGRLVGGKWRLDHLLGAGATSAVYVATHRNRSRAILKMMHPLLAADPTVRATFLREGYAGNLVPHEGVVRVLDDDVAEGGAVFLVLEMLEGQTVDEILETSGPLPVDEALRIAWHVLDVLDVAHAQGIQHRDLAPRNVVRLSDGRIKVIDFGSAAVAECAARCAPGQGAPLAAAFGRTDFMSPELARGTLSDVDPRSDVYACGAVLHAMLTGRSPRRTDADKLAAAASLTEQPADPATACPGVPRYVAELVSRALAFEKSDRWAAAKAMLEAVSAARTTLQQEAEASKEPIDDAAIAVRPVLEDLGATLVMPPAAAAPVPVPAEASMNPLFASGTSRAAGHALAPSAQAGFAPPSVRATAAIAAAGSVALMLFAFGAGRFFVDDEIGDARIPGGAATDSAMVSAPALVSPGDAVIVPRPERPARVDDVALASRSIPIPEPARATTNMKSRRGHVAEHGMPTAPRDAVAAPPTSTPAAKRATGGPLVRVNPYDRRE